MKHLFLAIIGACLVFSCSGKVGNDDGKKEAEEPVLPAITVSRLSQQNGKVFLEVDGEPFAVYGVQIRLDLFISADHISWDEIEIAFQKAAELGVNCVQVTYPWAFLQPASEHRFSFKEIDKAMELVNKYGLKMELLWFSTNMIGDSYSWLGPAYILRKAELRLQRDGDGWDHYLYGQTYSLIFNDPWLMEKERIALTRLFSHIRWWDAQNGEKHPVIACQIHNETDGLVRWRKDEKHIGWKNGSQLSNAEAWKMTLDALDNAGQAVQNSNYKVATRTNLIFGNGAHDFPQTPGISPKDVFALQGIDFVSYDPYKDKINELIYEIADYASLPGNYPFVAENRGSYLNSSSLILAASALGAGYDLYDLVPCKTLYENSQPPFDSEGVFDYNYVEKAHTSNLRILLKGLSQVSKDIALTTTDDFAVFNVVQDSPAQSISQNIATTGAYLRFESECGTPGFVLDRGDCLIAFSIYDACLTVTGGSIEGYANGVIPLTGGRVYRLPFHSNGKHASTTKKFIGTLFN